MPFEIGWSNSDGDYGGAEMADRQVCGDFDFAILLLRASVAAGMSAFEVELSERAPAWRTRLRNQVEADIAAIANPSPESLPSIRQGTKTYWVREYTRNRTILAPRPSRTRRERERTRRDPYGNPRRAY